MSEPATREVVVTYQEVREYQRIIRVDNTDGLAGLSEGINALLADRVSLHPTFLINSDLTYTDWELLK